MDCILKTCLSVDGIKNFLCLGKPNEHCMCCFCCLKEEDRVGRVFDHFSPMPVASAPKCPNMLNMFVGRVTLPDDPMQMGHVQCCYTPGTQKPCVYWRVIVEEQWVTWHRVDEYAGTGDNRRKVGSHYEHRLVWRTCCDYENFMDFYLQDGPIKVYINGSKRGDTRIQSSWDAAGSNHTWMPFTHEQLPPGIKWLCPKHGHRFGGWERSWHTGGFGRHQHRLPDLPTGHFRWKECKFEVNEKLACLGLASPAYNDPYTQTICTALIPVMVEQISKGQMEAVGDPWSAWDRFSWVELQRDDPDGTVLLTDLEKYTGSIDVKPAVNLPRWQTVLVPQYAPWGGHPGMAPPPVQAVVVPAPQQLTALDTDGDGRPDTMVPCMVATPAVIAQVSPMYQPPPTAPPPPSYPPAPAYPSPGAPPPPAYPSPGAPPPPNQQAAVPGCPSPSAPPAPPQQPAPEYASPTTQPPPSGYSTAPPNGQLPELASPSAPPMEVPAYASPAVPPPNQA